MTTHSLFRPLTVEPSLDPPAEDPAIACLDCGDDLDDDRTRDHITGRRLGWTADPLCATCRPDCGCCSSRADVRMVEGEPLCPGCRGDV